MYAIRFYRDKNGKEPVKEYIAKLAAKKVMKRTQKTPQKEIERAKRNLADYQGRKHHENK